MGPPPEPLRSKFLKMVELHYPWFAVGRDLRFSQTFIPNSTRLFTIRKIAPEIWAFWVEERGVEYWLKFTFNDIISKFVPADMALDKVDRVLG